MTIINEVANKFAHIETFNNNVDEMMKIGFLLAALPNSWDEFSKTLVNASDDQQTWSTTISKLVREEREKEYIQRSKLEEKAMIGTTKKNNGNKCVRCPRPNHVSRDCYLHPQR